MSPGQLKRARRTLDALRARKSSIRADELIRLAKSIGRKKVKRGGELTYEMDRPGWFAIAIPKHPGTLKIGTAVNILDALEEDIERLEQEQGRKEVGNGKEHPEKH